MRSDVQQKTYFAKADYRGKEQVFGIKAVDRSKHVYVIGKTGMGKTALLQNMAVQDIQNGNGLAFMDPHGEVAANLLDYVPEERVQDVIHFAPFDVGYPISFNVMEDVGYDKRHLVVSGLISTFKKIWPDVWSSRMEYILSNTLFALLEYPESTLLDVNRMLVNKEFRKDVVAHITDPIVKSFWVDEFANYTDRYTQEATPAIQNKIGQFVSNPLIRNIIGQPTSSFDFRKAMDEKKVLIINLSKGRIGDTNSKLIGSMLIIKIYLAAMSRADTTSEELAKLPSFYFFVDEFQSFANETFADILSESRKYKLSLTIAHQYIGQMPDEVREAVLGNVGTMIAFRVGAEDAEMLEKEFSPTFMATDLVNLGLYQIYLKLMIDGLASKPFSATTLPPIEKLSQSLKQEVVKESRRLYAHSRAEVEEAILKRHVPPPSPEKPQKEFSSREGRRPRSDYGVREQRPFSSRDEAQRPREARYDRGAPSESPRVSGDGRYSRASSTEGRYTVRGEERRPYERRDFPQRQEIHQPFKAAFSKSGALPNRDREISKNVAREEKPVSLSTLESRPQKRDSAEEASLLRKTLEEALKEKAATGAKPLPEESKEKKDTPPTSSSVKEVPEEELKKILDISDGGANAS